MIQNRLLQSYLEVWAVEQFRHLHVWTSAITADGSTSNYAFWKLYLLWQLVVLVERISCCRLSPEVLLAQTLLQSKRLRWSLASGCHWSCGYSNNPTGCWRKAGCWSSLKFIHSKEMKGFVAENGLAQKCRKVSMQSIQTSTRSSAHIIALPFPAIFDVGQTQWLGLGAGGDGLTHNSTSQCYSSAHALWLLLWAEHRGLRTTSPEHQGDQAKLLN